MSTIPTLKSGVKGEQGRRDSMEDTHKVIDDAFSETDIVENINKSNHNLIAFYGVYDGHGGKETAMEVESVLHLKLFNNPNFNNNIMEAINRSFEETDNHVINMSNDRGWANGCTAVVSLLLDNILYTANVGDSEAILISEINGQIVTDNLTTAHKANDPEEKQRILEMGGHVFFNRLFGVLAVSRSFGDSRYKKPKTSQNFVSWEPAICIKELNPNHKALVLACDGLWDVLSHAEVGEKVIKEINAGKNSQQISEILVSTALDKYSEDNVTVIVVLFNWDQPQQTTETNQQPQTITETNQQPQTTTQTNQQPQNTTINETTSNT